MLRCSRAYVLCLEVSLPMQAKVMKHFDHAKQEIRESTAHSYSWNRERVLRKFDSAWVDVRSTYLHPASLGPYYKAFLAHKSPMNRGTLESAG